MPELHMEARLPHPVPQSGRSHTQETFPSITADDLPAEILIPALLYNPLPLQCLAADALPIQIKEEIDQITSAYGDMDSEQPKIPAVSECSRILANSNLSSDFSSNADTNINCRNAKRRGKDYAYTEKAS